MSEREVLALDALPRIAAGKVLAALRDEGLVVTTPGWGSFVAEQR